MWKVSLIKHREYSLDDKTASKQVECELYHGRNILEAISSAIKRKYGSWVRSHA